MPFPQLARLEERNFTGICHFDVVAVEDVASLPAEAGGNIAGDVVLVDGASWSRVYLEDDGGEFTDRWRLKDGDQYSEAEATGAIAKDRLALMPSLWELKGQRFLVRFTNKNGDALLMGTKSEPATILVTERATGSGDRMESERNEYRILITLARRKPVPFHGGTVPDPQPGDDCPTMVEQMADSDGPGIAAALASAGQTAAVQAEICSSGPATVRDTADTVDVMTIAAGGSGTLPQSTIKYKTRLNANAELDPSDTEFDSTHLKPSYRIPRRALKNSVGTGYDFASVEGIVNDTLPAAPDVSIGINGTGVATAPAGTSPNLLVVDDDDNPVGSWVTDKWVVPAAGGATDRYYAIAIGA